MRYGLSHDALHESAASDDVVRWLVDVDKSLLRAGRLPTYDAEIFARSPTTDRGEWLYATFARFARPRASIVTIAWRQLDPLMECGRSLRTTLTGSLPCEISQGIKDAVRRQTEGVLLANAQPNLRFSTSARASPVANSSSS